MRTHTWPGIQPQAVVNSSPSYLKVSLGGGGRLSEEERGAGVGSGCSQCGVWGLGGEWERAIGDSSGGRGNSSLPLHVPARFVHGVQTDVVCLLQPWNITGRATTMMRHPCLPGSTGGSDMEFCPLLLLGRQGMASTGLLREGQQSRKACSGQPTSPPTLPQVLLGCALAILLGGHHLSTSPQQKQKSVTLFNMHSFGLPLDRVARVSQICSLPVL